MANGPVTASKVRGTKKRPKEANAEPIAKSNWRQK